LNRRIRNGLDTFVLKSMGFFNQKLGFGKLVIYGDSLNPV
jgi:hypothetical protein